MQLPRALSFISCSDVTILKLLTFERFALGPAQYIAQPAGGLHVAEANGQSSVFILLELSAVSAKASHSLLHDTFLFSLVSEAP